MSEERGTAFCPNCGCKAFPDFDDEFGEFWTCSSCGYEFAYSQAWRGQATGSNLRPRTEAEEER